MYNNQCITEEHTIIMRCVKLTAAAIVKDLYYFIQEQCLE